MTQEHTPGTFNLWFKNSPFYMSHDHCVLYDPGVIFLDFWGNIMVGIAYMLTPLLLMRLIIGMWREMTPSTKGMTVHLALFVLLCGTTHFIHAYNWHHAAYVAQAIFEIITGIVSMWFTFRLFFFIRNRKWET